MILVKRVSGAPSDMFYVSDFKNYKFIDNWCSENNVKLILLGYSSHSYMFKIITNVEWFILKWI